MRTNTVNTDPKSRLQARYIVMGLITAGLWLLSGNTPAWQHLTRAGIIIAIVLTVPDLIRRRRPDGAAQPRIAIGRMLVARLALLAVAAVANVWLGHVTNHATVIVAAALAVVLATAGPRVHHRFVVPASPQPRRVPQRS